MSKKTVARDLNIEAQDFAPRVARVNECADYLRLLANRMALCDWSFVVSPDPPQVAGRVAEITPIWGRHLAELRVTRRFSTLPPETRRHVLVHELIHCHFAAAHLYADEILEGFSPPSRRAFDLNLEMGVDGLADAMAPLLPLPNF